ncbi:MAG: ComEC/Rec2 family competence protein [Cyanobacteriota bacterium]
MARALALLALLLLLLTGCAPQPGPADPLQRLQGSEGPMPVRLEGTLLEDPVALAPEAADAGPCRALLQAAGGRTDLHFPRCPALRQGWRLRLEGELRRPRPAPHPLLAGPAERLARQGSWTRLEVRHVEVLSRPPTPIADLRRRLAGRLIAAAGPERGGLLAALVLGSAVVPLPAELREAFRASGLSHALAASGFHLTVLLGAVMVLARPLGSHGRLLVAGAAKIQEVLLAGPQPSVVRAVLTSSFALAALETGRRGRPLGLLALAVALMLAFRPDWLFDVGFQLSVASTAGLIVSAAPLERALLARLPARLAPRRWAPELAVVLAATLWTLPLQLLHFGAVPAYAIPANLLAAPLLAPLTLGAMVLAVVALALPALLPLLLPPVALMAGLLLALARAAAALPMAQWQTGRPQPWLVLLLALALLLIVLPDPRPRRWWLALSLVALATTVHLGQLRADQLLLVHQAGGGGRTLLIARHQGRAALIGTAAEGGVCRQARRLATGLGIGRFDWLLLLDPVASDAPACWNDLAGRVLAYGQATAPLAAGQRLVSPGLAVEALSMDSHALALSFGQRRWLLLPDRPAWWAARRSLETTGAGRGFGGRGFGGRAADGLWLGFPPSRRDRTLVQRQAPPRVWLSGEAPAPSLPRGWQASGASGFLMARGG